MNIGQHPITGGMVQQLNKLDIIANNLANSNTTGYKEKNITTETFSALLSNYPKKLNLNIDRNTVEGASFINQSLNMIPVPGHHYTKDGNGSLQFTGNNLDFAIVHKNSFFIVENPKTHERFLTRDGSFVQMGDYLKTKDGLNVLSNNLTPIDTKKEGFENRLALINDKYENMKPVGNNLYNTPNKLDNVTKLISTKDVIIQGNLETSNINGVMEMTKMIETNRLFEQLTKISKTLQETDSLSNKEIGKA